MYATADELASLSRLLKSHGDPESAAGAARFPYTPDDVAYMRGVRLMRVGAYGDAERAFAALPGSFWARAAAWLSTPFIGYDDLLWKGEMVEVLKRATLDGWPFMSRGLSAKASGRLATFLNEYDSHAAAARYLKRALAVQKNPEAAARVALALWRALAEPSYSDSVGSPSHAAAGDADQVARTIVQKYGRTAAVANYRNSFDDGCPGLGASRVGLSALRGLGRLAPTVDEARPGGPERYSAPRPPWLR
jgi:hypothetical protein